LKSEKEKEIESLINNYLFEKDNPDELSQNEKKYGIYFKSPETRENLNIPEENYSGLIQI